ncbi:MAG TPA: hypothetical protein VLE72_02780 [Candidatus Saccharimonadales bacterium]|nr:hypothetical protein [Candidatus Saccharimonadales bacterium]
MILFGVDWSDGESEKKSLAQFILFMLAAISIGIIFGIALVNSH